MVMKNKLKKLNPQIELYSVYDSEFKTYGRILNLNTEEIIKTAERFDMPQNIMYMPSTDEFEELHIAKTLREEFFGTLPAQVGYCYGHSKMLNATEWHTSSEINIAVTDLVLILAHIWEIEDNKIDSSVFKAFYVPKGSAIEVFATSLHYCPCQVSDDGFGCVVALPKGTNTALETEVFDKRITAKNKWLIAHVENVVKINQGAVAGITGINYEIKY